MIGSLPQALVDCLLDSALEPVLDAAAARGAKALLEITVCDPACGSGDLLLAAASRIARRVAETRELDPSPDARRRAMREVVDCCIYGVDVSDEAVERTKDRLRRAADVPGMAPPWLDERIRPGNALLGGSPDLIEGGVPDQAFRPGDGDDPRYARSLRRANTRPDPGQATLFSAPDGYSHANQALARSSAAFQAKRLVADAWCAAFAWAKTPDAPPAVVNQVLLDLQERGTAGVVPETLAEIDRLRDRHSFFHWYLEFPGVFRVTGGDTRWRGGFSCVLSAPPWDKVNRHGEAALFRFATGSGAYPWCTAGLAEPGVSALRTDHLFTERITTLLAPGGYAGCAVAPGTAAAAGARHLIGGLMRRGVLASLYDFAGAATPLGLLTMTAGAARADPARADPARADPARTGTARFAFGLTSPADLGDEGRSFTLTPDEAPIINPNTGALPAFRGSRDAALVTAIHRRVPVLCDETRADGNPWKMRLETAFPHAAGDIGLLRTEPELRGEGWERSGNTLTLGGQVMLPVYEPPMVERYDHQLEEPRYWMAEHGPVAVQRHGQALQRQGVADRLAELGWNWPWLCAWVAPVRERSAVAVFLPRAATTGSLPLMLPRVVPPFAAALIAAQSSLIFGYVARQKIDGPAVRAGQWKQLPVPAPSTVEPHLPFIVPRVLELVYTSSDMRPLARDLDDTGEPFAWDLDRRASLLAELDALFFRVYGIDDRDDVKYVIDTLQAGPGELILAAYDRMAEPGAEYESPIFPPPGHRPRTGR